MSFNTTNTTICPPKMRTRAVCTDPYVYEACVINNAGKFVRVVLGEAGQSQAEVRAAAKRKLKVLPVRWFVENNV